MSITDSLPNRTYFAVNKFKIFAFSASKKILLLKVLPQGNNDQRAGDTGEFSVHAAFLDFACLFADLSVSFPLGLVWLGFCFFSFKSMWVRMHVFHFRLRGAETKDRELLSAALPSICPHQLGLDQAAARARNSIQASRMTGRVPGIWVVTAASEGLHLQRAGLAFVLGYLM